MKPLEELALDELVPTGRETLELPNKMRTLEDLEGLSLLTDSETLELEELRRQHFKELRARGARDRAAAEEELRGESLSDLLEGGWFLL